ncbi:Intraflagellar transport protein 74, partial [Borealophlyctis nickersoniae]
MYVLGFNSLIARTPQQVAHPQDPSRTDLVVGRGPRHHGEEREPYLPTYLHGRAWRRGWEERGLGLRCVGGLVFDRPMTQQGLGGMKTGVQGPGRMVQDRTFYQSELRQRITLLSTELAKLNTEYDTMAKEN